MFKSIFLSAVCLVASIAASAAVEITAAQGWFQSAYVTWTNDSQYDAYNVYCKAADGDYAIVDSMLVRNYGTYGRADVMGLKAGDYQLKVVPVKNSSEVASDASESAAVSVVAHDRSGFAFMGSSTPGAYKADGSLKSNAVVLYVTNSNIASIAMDVVIDSKGTTDHKVGLVSIMEGFKKGYDSRPLDVRFIGTVYSDVFDANSDCKGDAVIDAVSCGVTFEGVGSDATAYGWGIRLKNSDYCEVANLGFVLCDSNEGDNVGLQQANTYIWVHNCDMFYGAPGSDSDQVKGDGALDCKKSNYVTFSYNHFWDNGKCNLLGLSEGVVSTASNAYFITYHHNWYDHSDSRHPRCRYYNAHVYNNYYDGNAKYGAGSTLGSSVFMENNYFRNCKFPMLTSMQGSDVYAGSSTRDTKNNPTFSSEDGGVIKAFGNSLNGTYTFIPYGAQSFVQKGSSVDKGSIDTEADFDAYVVDSRSATVPSSVTSYKGGNVYSNFDTNSSLMYSYEPQDASDVVSTLQGWLGAGRIGHGDIAFAFDNSSDDTSYDINASLKALLTNYQPSLVDFYGRAVVSDPVASDDDDDDVSSGESGNSGSTSASSDWTCFFSGNTPSSSNFTVSGSYSDSKGSVTVNGTSYTIALKLNSSASISFTAPAAGQLTIYCNSSESSANFKIDGTVVTGSGNVVSTSVDAGSHTITKNSGEKAIFFISFEFDNSSIRNRHASLSSDAPTFDLAGRRVNPRNLVKGHVYVRGGLKFVVL